MPWISRIDAPLFLITRSGDSRPWPVIAPTIAEAIETLAQKLGRTVETLDEEIERIEKVNRTGVPVAQGVKVT